MPFKPLFKRVFIMKYFLINHLTHFRQACIKLVIFVLYFNFIESSGNLQCLSVELPLKQFHVHRSRCNYHFEITPFVQQITYQTYYHIDANGTLMSLVDYQARILFEQRIFSYLIKDQTIKLKDDFGIGVNFFVY